MAPMAASSAAPELGLRVTSVVVATDPDPVLQLASRSNVPTVVNMNLPPDWRLRATSLRLAPGQEVDLPFTKTGAAGTLQLTQTMADPPPGVVTGALQVNTKLLSTKPVAPTDWTPLIALVLALVVMVLLLAAASYWLSKHVQVTRR